MTIDELESERAKFKRYNRTFRTLIMLMLLTWLAAIPVITFAPIYLVVTIPMSLTFGSIAWWFWLDNNYKIVEGRDRYGNRQEVTKRGLSPRAKLEAAERKWIESFDDGQE